MPGSGERPLHILPVIVLSQFAGTSLWFAVNAVLFDLGESWSLGSNSAGVITSAIQFGFIFGTLLFAVSNISDRFSPRWIFFLSSISGALCNLCLYFFSRDLQVLLLLRFLTGICLAGIYPVGMKIASGWYRRELGNALGFLVGALVLGTSFPHFLRGLSAHVEWESVILTISALSAGGGTLMLLLVPDGPHLVKGTPFNRRALSIIFGSNHLRAAAFGYFGHMWELYTFYAFVPFMLSAYQIAHPQAQMNISLWSFCIIGAGSIGCIAGGMISNRIGSALVAWTQLFLSGIFCLGFPFLFAAPFDVFIGLMIVWGIVVVGDSPQFSALIARHAPKEFVGSALTIGNSIGFAITIVSIQTISLLSGYFQAEHLFMFLAVGPAIGLLYFTSLLKSSPPRST